LAPKAKRELKNNQTEKVLQLIQFKLN